MQRYVTLFFLIFLIPHLLSAQADLSFEEQNAKIYENLDFSEVSAHFTQAMPPLSAKLCHF